MIYHIWKISTIEVIQLSKAARGRAVCIVGGGCRRRKMTVQALTSSFDRLRLWATAEHRVPSTPQRAANGFADATSETYCRFSVFLFAVA